jgi:pentatricopeptide repeat protein
VAVETNQLAYLIEAYAKIGSALSEQKEYEKAIRLFKKMLKCIWIEGDTKQEIKLYEKLALQYFYLQDMDQCKKYQDRAHRGKLEGVQSSAKSMSLFAGFRSSDDR